MSYHSFIRRLHPIAGGVGLATIAIFQVSTLLVETFGSPADIAAVKIAILWALPLLIASLASAGATGFRLSTADREGRAVKIARMKQIARNGLLVLVPAAFFLAWKAASHTFDVWFYSVQAAEFLAGAVNFALLACNMRDGLAHREGMVAFSREER